MSDELINRIASRIKSREEKAAIENKLQLHKIETIKEKGEAFFGEVEEHLTALLESLNTALEGSESAEPKATIKKAQGGSILYFGKENFPVVKASLTVKPNRDAVDFSVRTAPKPGATPVSRGTFWNFDLDPDNQIFLKSGPKVSPLLRREFTLAHFSPSFKT